MTTDRNPQAEQMGDESMARNLAFQAQAIWPQEQVLFERYGLSGEIRILDLGCGTGEITRRLALRYPQAHVVGIDILEGNLATRWARYAPGRVLESAVLQRVLDDRAMDYLDWMSAVASEHLLAANDVQPVSMVRVDYPGGER